MDGGAAHGPVPRRLLPRLLLAADAPALRHWRHESRVDRGADLARRGGKAASTRPMDRARGRMRLPSLGGRRFSFNYILTIQLLF